MTPRPCTARRAPRLTPTHIYLARLQRLTWIPLTPLQRYRARMARLAEIADQCGLTEIAKSHRLASRGPYRVIDASDVALLRSWAHLRGPDAALPVVGRLLLLSAADETAALLRATGGAS